VLKITSRNVETYEQKQKQTSTQLQQKYLRKQEDKEININFMKLEFNMFNGVWTGNLLRKPGGRRPMGRPRRRWVDNIRLDLQEVGCAYMDWIGLAKDRDRWRTLVSAVMNLSGSVKWWEFLD